MKEKPRISLLWKMVLWLMLHLTCLAIVGGAIIFWQFRSGLDGLLRGPAGDRLRLRGEFMAAQLRDQPISEWENARLAIEDEFHIESDFWLPHGDFVEDGWQDLSPQLMERLRAERSLPMPRRGPSGPDGPPPRGPGPRPFGGPPNDDDFRDPLFDDLLTEEPSRPSPPQRNSRALQPVQPLFIIAEDNVVWAAVHLPLSTGQRPDHVTWVIRADNWSGNGLFFDTRPILLAILGILAFSILFWLPFALSITRYLQHLKHATEKISTGTFDVPIKTNRRDELGSLGTAITHMASRIDQLLRGQKRFLGDVAHELCSPLARLRTGLGILEHRLPEQEKHRIAGIEEDAQELATLVDELLAFSRSSAAIAPASLSPVSLTEIITTSIHKEIPDHTCHIHIPPDTSVLADPHLLTRAISNILRNIHRHAGPTATVTIRARSQADAIHLTIADDGPGVPADQLPRIFEPFYRADASRTRDTGGTGLGLTIVQSCIQACHGTIRAIPNEISGLHLEIILPAATKANQ